MDHSTYLKLLQKKNTEELQGVRQILSLHAKDLQLLNILRHIATSVRFSL